jgi:outer membrane protein assembly factor BamB
LLVIFSGVCIASAVGCRPSIAISPQATAWKPLEKDPLETGSDLDRWPGWRGRNGSGIAPGGDPPIAFSLAEGLRWTADVPGSGNSSPVVWDSLVFLTTALDTTNPPTLAVLALDRDTGSLRWKTDVGQAAGRTHTKNGYASATVVTDGSLVFASFGSTGLFCLDMSGQILWKADLGDLDQIWGSAASPILYRNLVIQLCDSEHESYLAAFDLQTGRPKWTAPRSSRSCWTTPILVSAPGPCTELVVNGTGAGEDGQGQVTAYNPDTGRELWQVRGTTGLVTPTTLAARDLIFSLSGRNGPMMAIRPGGSGDVTENRMVWRRPRGGPYIPSGVLYRNRLYVLADNIWLTCYDPGNGREIWRGRLGGAFSSSLIAAGGRLYAVNEQGIVFVVAAGDTFELLATNKLGERCYATPAIAHNDLFLRTQHHLHCFCKAATSGRGVGSSTQ